MSNSEALEKLKSFFDEGCFNDLDGFAKSENEDVNAICGFGKISGVDVYAYIQNGALDNAACKKLIKAYSFAERTGCPILSVFNSNGIKLDGGFEVLSTYGELVKCSSRISGVVPQIAVIDGNCLGVMSVCANLADVVIAVNNSDFSVTVPSDVTVEESYKSGVVDIVAGDSEEAASIAADVISLLPSNNLTAVPSFEFEELPVSETDGVLSLISDNQISVEFKGGYAENVKTVLTTVDGRVCGIICFNGGELCPAGAYKAEAFIKLCDAYNIPIITVADSIGLKSGCEAQMLTAATRLTSAYASATTAKISLITNEAFAGAYILLAGKGANADLTFAWESALVGPMTTESAVSFLWNERLANGESRESLEEEYNSSLGSPFEAAASGAIDDVFAREETKNKLSAALDMLSGKRESTIARKHTVK